ncbi:MAE_28990/MAE_18760 family HEPN-like nuclease [Solitalea canadensis]|uniref:MAE-28990/MAE-18760-like HEPN domain-containing protein n=1 Tax=Solitalea canadensis (strain ATCC 29591 / DSM 3403 / JCM 21819 / LMG 8368 / NBRC 15130 / NCIMB 12057 / USAM 9D) TaxID=929556 RepID=H8KNS4_SOLCM|nr:MAE_28990/MAE_18760 family HEPN-like nuclease [Solitalea canadensis]AFD05335.1 hypothetical protein Solca_0188 [Solitalea canadensis DSM 3403]
MMRYEEFEKLLDEDLAWRKVEISSLIMVAKNNSEEVILKSILLLLYAHWEGYIKNSSKLYIKYISDKNLKIGTLLGNFKAVALKNDISKCIDTKESLTLSSELAFLEQFLKIEQRNFNIKINLNDEFDSEIINTKSNLSPKVFKSIISIIGLNYKGAIKTREKYIDSNLLGNRNCIGHGSKFDKSNQVDFSLTLKDIEKLKDIIFSIIDNFRDEILEYINKEYFLESNKDKLTQFETAQEAHLENIIKSIEDSYK